MGEGPIPAQHNAALPFTRFVVGHGDYTPLGFTAPGPTTWAHQLATVVIFLSPLQVIAEDPEFLLKDLRVKPALSVIKAIPSVWDKTIVLDGSRIGELAAFARRSGKTWFVGILNGGNERTFQLNLNFLNSGEYRTTIIEDDLQVPKVNLTGLNPKAKLKEFVRAVPFKVSKRTVNQGNKINLVLARGGGFVGMFVPHTK
jgi:alpha-glucosidase